MKKILLSTVAVVLLAAGSAGAQPFEVGQDAKGVRGAIGCGLLGMELTMSIEAAAGVQNPWLLSLIPLAVGGGAAAGGYYMEQESSTAGVAMLAVGATLLVPAILLTLVLASETYEPTEDTTVTTERTAARQAPSLVRVAEGKLRLEVPALAVAEAPATSLYPAASRERGWEYRLSLLDWTF
jgi:hypothetical protein